MKKIPAEDFTGRTRSPYHPSVFEKNLDESHPHPHYDKAVFSWIAPEYLQHPKSIRWWVIAGLVFLFAIIAEALSGNWTMLLATVAFGAVYTYMHEYHPPRHTKINLSELGVKIGHRNIPYEEIEMFWIIYDAPWVRRLYLRLKNKLFPDLVIELEEQDPLAIRMFLENYLAEMVDARENLSDVLLRIIRL